MREPKQRFPVLHDYGMGGLWWWRPLNPPIDLHDPELAPWEIDPDDFEQVWRRARSES